MKIIADFSNQKAILQKKEGEKVYCTVDGVLQEVVYSKINENQLEYYENVRLTKQSRLRLQQSSTSQASFSASQKEDTETIYPICIFDYSKLIIERSNLVEYWGSFINNLYLSQTTEANKPKLGRYGKGVNGFCPIHFSIYNSSFMSLNSDVTLSGDFTMFFYVQIIGHPVNKYMRFLGKSDDNNMFFSAGDASNKSYIMKFDSSNTVQFDSSTYYYKPTTNPVLITVRRNSNNLEIRENGVTIGSETCPTTDFTFDQFGRTGNIDLSFNGALYHFSAYNGYLDKNLVKIENSIINNSQLAKE